MNTRNIELTKAEASFLNAFWRAAEIEMTDAQDKRLLSLIMQMKANAVMLKAGIKPADPRDMIPQQYTRPTICEPAASAKTVKCSCGHSVVRNQIMNASRGSCCPNCYDRMSD